MILNIESTAIPEHLRPLVKRLYQAGFSRANVEYSLSPSERHNHGISVDDLRSGLRTGLSFSSSEKGNHDWVQAGLINCVGVFDGTEPSATFVLNFDLVAD